MNAQSAYSVPRNYSNNYVQPYDLDLLERSVKKADSYYRNNFRAIQELDENVIKIYNFIVDAYNEDEIDLSESQIKLMNSYISFRKNIYQHNLANGKIVQEVYNTILAVGNTMLSWLE